MSVNFRSLRRALAACFAVALMSLPALAQEDARLEGVVRDANGAAVPHATVTLRAPALAFERTATSSGDGIYTFQQLRPGVYELHVTQNGFRTTQVNDLALGAGQARTLDVTLEAGGIGEEVTVTADATAATIDTGSNRLGVNVTAREVEELPVNGRNYSQLYLTAPGATNTGTGNFNELRFNARANEQNQSKLDGVENTAIFDASPGYLTVQGSQFRLQTSLENIQEFRVDSSNYPAEYGTGTGGQINVVGKSGSNEFHGSVFHYFRNDALDARNFFDAAEKSPLRLNQFGGSVGGRIIKDKLFFFTSYEGLRQRAGFNIIELTLSDFLREFIASNGTARRAELGLNPSAADVDRISALNGLGVTGAFPVGAGARVNLGGVTNGAQFVQVNRVARLDENAFSLRFDGRINPRHSWYARYQQDPGELVSPDGSTGRLLVATQKARHFVAAAQQVFGTSVINEVKFGINHSPTTLATSVPETGSGIDFSTVSVSLSGNVVQPGINGGAPTGIASPGGLTRQSSAGNGRAQPIDAISYSIIDNLSYTRGNHAFKFGGEFRDIQVDFDQLGGTTLTYGNLLDFALNRNLTGAFIGDLSAPGDFRIATNPVTTVSRPDAGFHRGRQFYAIWYAQDEWRVRPNVTLNYGVRYEYYSANREEDDRAILFDAGTGRLLDPSESDFYTATKGNFAPRLGLTWAPSRFNGKTVIRLGGGLYYGPGQYEDLIQPIESDVFRTNASFTNGLAANTLSALRNPSPTAAPLPFTPRAYDVTGYRVPERVGQYGISVQQELFGNTVLTVGYVGSQGRNLFLRSITNRILPGQAVIQNGQPLPSGVGVVNRCSTAPANGVCTGSVVGVTTIREFDRLGQRLDASGNVVADPTSRLQPFGEIDYKTSGGRDSYNALQVTVNRRFAQGLTLGGQYTWGHSIGNTQGSNEAQTSQDPFDFNAERGNNTFDIRHTANLSVLYELPVGRGQRFDLGGAAGAILGGWQIGGVYNGRSGLPINVQITRADLVIQCARAGGCPRGTGLSDIPFGAVGRLPGTVSAASPLPPGFIAVVNTPGGNASRNTRRPDAVAGVNPIINDGGLRYLNPAAFAIPQAGAYGNLSRNAVFGPSFHQFDLTFQKRFPLTETVGVEFRTEVYNIFNKANFANPPAILSENLPNITFNPTTGVTTVGSGLQPGQPFTESLVGNFGVFNGTVGRTVGLGTNRQIQFALRLNF
jgi:hypothetical protein